MSQLNSINSDLKNKYNCVHSNHLFTHPLCKHQSLLKKIANVVFHVFTLAIPLTIYYFVSRSRFRTFFQKNSDTIVKTGIDSFAKDTITPIPYSTLGQKAIDFAEEELQKHLDITPNIFSAGHYGPELTNQPVNPKIARLTTIYFNYYKDFENLLKEKRANPWQDPEILAIADKLMKITYVISNLTLDDLELFTKNLLSSKGEVRSYAKALKEQDSYQYRTFFYCPIIYMIIRRGSIWGQMSNRINGPECLIYPDDIPQEHENSFYAEETIQSSWKELYNNYCDRVRSYVSDDELHKADLRHVKWTVKDTDKSFSQRLVSTLPT